MTSVMRQGVTTEPARIANLPKTRNQEEACSGSGTVRPADGSRVMGTVNLKESLGYIPLQTAMGVGKVIRNLFEGRIEYSPVGASAFGAGIEIPKAWKRSRLVSNIMDIQLKEGDDRHAMSILLSAGWNQHDPRNFFSVTFAGNDKEVHTVSTICPQRLFSKEVRGSGITYLTTIIIPAEFYRVQNGKVSVVRLDHLQSPGETLSYKLLRWADRDKIDLIQISIANDLRRLLDENGKNVIKTAVDAAPKLRQVIDDRINHVISGAKNFGGTPRLVMRNIEVLTSLMRG